MTLQEKKEMLLIKHIKTRVPKKDNNNKEKNFRISFSIIGTMLGNEIELNKRNIEEVILEELSMKGLHYYRNRDIDCEIKDLRIEEN